MFAILLMALFGSNAVWGLDGPMATGQTTQSTGAATAQNQTGATLVTLAKQNPPPAPQYVFWTIFGIVTFTLVFTLGGIVFALFKGGFSLQSLLSEDGDGSGKPSASRLIALLGLVPVMTVVVGVGYATIWRLLAGGDTTGLPSIGSYLGAGAGVVAPYVANQIGGAIANKNASLLSPSGPIPPPKY